MTFRLQIDYRRCAGQPCSIFTGVSMKKTKVGSTWAHLALLYVPSKSRFHGFNLNREHVMYVMSPALQNELHLWCTCEKSMRETISSSDPCYRCRVSFQYCTKDRTTISRCIKEHTCDIYIDRSINHLYHVLTPLGLTSSRANVSRFKRLRRCSWGCRFPFKVDDKDAAENEEVKGACTGGVESGCCSCLSGEGWNRRQWRWCVTRSFESSICRWDELEVGLAVRGRRRWMIVAACVCPKRDTIENMYHIYIDIDR